MKITLFTESVASGCPRLSAINVESACPCRYVLTVLENIDGRATRHIAADPAYSRGTGGTDQDQILQGFEFDIVPWRGGRRFIRECIVLPNQRMLE